MREPLRAGILGYLRRGSGDESGLSGGPPAEREPEVFDSARLENGHTFCPSGKVGSIDF